MAITGEELLARLIKSALSAACLTGLSVGGVAVAQTTTAPPHRKPKTLQEIVVTGSHIRRAELETDNPVVKVSRQQILATGKVTLGAVVQDLPVIMGGLRNPGVDNGGGSGATEVGLRGLGASRTLILVDGQRVLNKDLNSIPTAAVEQVQVLTSGASAIYGSDAIGGVINFILRSNYNGAQFNLNTGISTHGDGQRHGASFMFGHSSDKGSILAGVSYQKFDPILADSRKFSSDDLSLVSDDHHPGFKTGGSISAPRDHILVSPALASMFGCDRSGQLALDQSAFSAGVSPTTPGDYHCFGAQPGDRFNVTADQDIQVPQERTNAFFKGVFHLSNNVSFFATYYHNTERSVQQLAPSIIQTAEVAGTLISAQSYYNPFGINFSQTSGGQFNDRLVTLGPRDEFFRGVTDQLISGFKGHLTLAGHHWEWDVGYNYGHESVVRTFENYPNINTLQPGLGPSFLNADGVVQCGTPSSPISLTTCTPWDIFNLNSPSALQAMRAGSTTVLTNSWDIERTYHADASGGIFDLPAGTAQLAVGADYRKEYQDNAIGGLLKISPATLTCILGTACSAHVQGGFGVKEAYAELFVPILSDVPFAHGLNITLADRYSKYTNFGSTDNWKVGMEWRPIQDLLVRGTVSRVFRAPTIGDIFQPPESSAPFISSDPCDGITAANPACVGVPTNGSFQDIDDRNSEQLKGLTEGSSASGFPLGPEKGKSFDFGLVYSPHQVPGLSASVDFWRIYLNDVITTIRAQTVLNECFKGNADFCPLIHRISSGSNAGQIIDLVEPIGNLGRLDVKGTDFSLDYRLPSFAVGQFTVGLNATYLQEYRIETAPGTSANAVVNGAGLIGLRGSELGTSCSTAALCFMARVRALATADWERGPWSAQWKLRYYSKFGDYRTSTGAPCVQGITCFGSYVENDVSLGYDIAAINTALRVGIDNVMNKQPPVVGANTGFDDIDPEDFDTIGRFYWANVTVSF